jgi:glycosyltransferase involved in cell wall biosynthesis
MRELAGLKISFLAGTLEHGGAERQLLYILQTLCQGGAAVRVLCLDRGEFWEEPIKSLGVPVVFVGAQPSRLKRLLRIIKELRKNPPDVFQSQHFFANAYVSLAAGLLGSHSVGAMRNDGVSEVLGSGRVGGLLNLRLPRVIAANSQTAIDYAMAQGVPLSRLYLLPNVVDTNCFSPANPTPEGPITLLGAGRLVKQKRFDRFVSILARLRNQFHLNVRGVIVGPSPDDGSVREELEGQAGKLGLMPDGVEFRGAVSDMAPLYQETSVCVLTSDHEGTPNVLLEAMASGLPIVASRVGGVPGIVQHQQTGFLVEPEDLHGFIAALLPLAKDSKLRREMGSRARTYIECNHSLQRLPSFLNNLYRRVLPHKREPLPSLQRLIVR